jgi:acylphosphatase
VAAAQVDPPNEPEYVSPVRRVHLRVYGVVQGVFFRASTRSAAVRLGVAGWVRNCPDGSVECLAEGPAGLLEQLIAFCREGPPGARVDRVEEQWSAATREFDRFQVTYW